MASFSDLTFDEIVSLGEDATLRKGQTGTEMVLEKDPLRHGGWKIFEYNSKNRIIGNWIIRPGFAYRITPGKVKELPLIENDPDAARRLARLLGWSLRNIVALGPGEEFKYRPRAQGDNGKYSLPDGVNISVQSFWTCENPEYQRRIVTRKGVKITWEEAQAALIRRVSPFKEGVDFEGALKYMNE